MTESLPSGTVTVLFTDIEDSSRLWEQQPDAMPGAVARHDELLARAVDEHRGHVVKWTGDGVLAVFADAEAAVRAAVAAQRALCEEPDGLRVRMGLHTGRAEPAGDDYHGPTVNRAARIMGLAHGGQILTSGATAALASGADCTFRDLGRHPLRGLDQPEQIHQVIAAGLRESFPAISGVSSIPAARSTFIGRDAEIATVMQLLERHRLVTLTGVGGVGKTRLALEVARAAMPRFEIVGVAELAPLADPGAMPAVVATAIGLHFGGDVGLGPAIDVTEAILRHLGGRPALIVLDNCEHLLDATADLAETVLAACAGTRVLATSREALELDGEQTYRVPSLPVDEARSLFTDRAAAVRSTYAPRGQERAAIDDICRRLDGIPLAIELAASRASHLSAREIAARLDDRFRLLVGGGRRRVQRQQTLQATLDWSHDLLDPDEQSLLRRLSVFVGGFDLAAAEQVCCADLGTPVVDVLGSLVAKSLVAVDEDPVSTRYGLLETVRLYAQDKLAASSEVDATRWAHCDHYLTWAEGLEPWKMIWEPSTVMAIRTERDNLRAGLEWAAASDREDLVARFVRALFTVWWLDLDVAEAGDWADRIDTARLDPALAADVEGVRAIVSVLRLEPRERWLEAGERAVASGASAWALAVGWMSIGVAGRAEAFAKGVAAAREGGMPNLEMMNIAMLSWFKLTEGAVHEGLQLAREAATLVPGVGIAQLGLAVALHIGGHHEEAYAAARHESLAIASPFFESSNLAIEALTEAAVGDPLAARARLASAGREAGSQPGAFGYTPVPTLLLGYAGIAAMTGDAARAALILGSIDRPPGWRLSFVTVAIPIYAHYQRMVRDALGRVEADALMADGRGIRRLVILEQELARSPAP